MPKTGRHFYNIVITHKFIYWLCLIVAVVVVSNIFFVSNYMKMKHSVAVTETGKDKATAATSEVKDEVNKLKEETAGIKQDLDAIRETNLRIQKKTGIKVEPGNLPGRMTYTHPPSRALSSEVDLLREQLRVYRAEVEARKQASRNTEKKINNLVAGYNSVPAVAPVSKVDISSPFGYRIHPVRGGREFHSGIDLRAPSGTPIYATADGVVKYTGWRNGYGLTVMIEHASGFETLYAHNSRNRVREGQRVTRGQWIADIGTTGTTTGAHVHYEVRYKNRLLNPQRYLNVSFDSYKYMF